MLHAARTEEGIYRREYDPEISRLQLMTRVYMVRMDNGHGTGDTVVRFRECVERVAELRAELREMVEGAWEGVKGVWGGKGEMSCC